MKKLFTIGALLVALGAGLYVYANEGSPMPICQPGHHCIQSQCMER